MYLVLIIYRTYYHANIYFVYASTSYLDRRAFTLNIGTLIINVFGKFYNLSTILFGVITTSFHISTIIINSRTTYIYIYARNNLFLRGETPHWKFLGLKDRVSYYISLFIGRPSKFIDKCNVMINNTAYITSFVSSGNVYIVD